MAAIRANSVLPARPEGDHPAHRRRAALVGELALPGGPRPGRDAGLPAPAADPRRDDGQPRVPQGGLPAARAGRHRRAALQHPRHGQHAGHQRGQLRQRRGRAVRRGGGHRVRRVPRPAPDLAGRLVVRHRPGADARPRPGGPGRDPAVAAAAVQRRRAPGGVGGVRQAADRARARARRLPAARRRPSERFAVVPQAEVVGVDGAKHLWVGDAETVLDEIVRRVAPDVAVPLPTRVGRPDGDRRHLVVRRPDDRCLQGRAGHRRADRASACRGAAPRPRGRPGGSPRPWGSRAARRPRRAGRRRSGPRSR